MSFFDGKRKRGSRYRPPLTTRLVAERDPTPQESAHGADRVFIRVGGGYKLFTILVKDNFHGYYQFGEPKAILDENIEDASAWFRARRIARSPARNREAFLLRDPMTDGHTA